MRYCICGKVILRRNERGHREREYCSDTCRQRACRIRNKHKHDLDRISHEAMEREWNAIEQHIHRESWQDDLERSRQLLLYSHQELEQERIATEIAEARNKLFELELSLLREQLANKEAEITHLKVLLGNQVKRRP